MSSVLIEDGPRVTINSDGELVCHKCLDTYVVEMPCPLPILQGTMEIFRQMHRHRNEPPRGVIIPDIPETETVEDRLVVEKIETTEQSIGIEVGFPRGAEYARRFMHAMAGSFLDLFTEAQAFHFISQKFQSKSGGPTFEIILQRDDAANPSQLYLRLRALVQKLNTLLTDDRVAECGDCSIAEDEGKCPHAVLAEIEQFLKERQTP